MQVRPINPEQLLRSLRRDGIVGVEHFVDQSLLEEIGAEFDYLLSHRIVSLRRRRSSYLFRGRVGVTDGFAVEQRHLAAIPRILGLFQLDSLRQVACGYLSRNAMFCKRIQARRLVDDRLGSEVHFDSIRSLKFMIYLTDTGERNGALRYAAGSHRSNSEFRRSFLVRGNRVIDIPNVPAPDEAVEMAPQAARAGSLIIFDTDGFHSAGTLLPGHERRSLISTSLPSILSPLFNPPWYTPQGLREHRLNPLRKLASPPVPKGRGKTQGMARARVPRHEDPPH